MPNEQQERQIPENKVKEYVERAIKLDRQLFEFGGKTDDEIRRIIIAQMLQREEHFNNKNS